MPNQEPPRRTRLAPGASRRSSVPIASRREATLPLKTIHAVGAAFLVSARPPSVRTAPWPAPRRKSLLHAIRCMPLLP